MKVSLFKSIFLTGITTIVTTIPLAWAQDGDAANDKTANIDFTKNKLDPNFKIDKKPLRPTHPNFKIDETLKILIEESTTKKPMNKINIRGSGDGNTRRILNEVQVSTDLKLLMVDGSPIVEIVAKRDTDSMVKALEVMENIEVVACEGNQCSVKMPPEAIKEVAKKSQVLSIRGNFPTTNAGIVDNQADDAMRADLARQLFDVDGKGVKVCVLSDSFNCQGGAAQDIREKELPTFSYMQIVEDLDYPGCLDEGRAMMQLIHDIAPGARLAFHTAFLGEAGFASGIRRLVGLGCDIIVDDISYLTAPVYQDGVIAQAVDFAKESGVAYFSSAGNSAREAWEGPFVRTIGNRLDFSGGISDAPQNTVWLRIAGGARFTLQWSDPYVSVSNQSPGAKTDLDIIFFDEEGRYLFGSFDYNIGADPYEFISIEGTGVIKVQIIKFDGPDPELVTLLGYGNVNVLDNTPFIAGTIRGHHNARGTIAIAAAQYINTPAFGEEPAKVNSYSSAGGVPILYSADGERLEQEDIRFQPSVTGPDGTCTSFFGQLDVFGTGVSDCHNFFGTSAAAPNVAAIAALMLEKESRLRPDDIKEILERTAWDMDDPYTPWFDHGYDLATGHGFVDAVVAVSEAKLPVTDNY